MRVLFVCSGNSSFGIIPFIKIQGESLANKGIEVDYYLIKGSGFGGYYKNIKPLSEKLKENKYDIIHAHYSLCGWVAFFAKKKEKLIVSLMGDDAYGSINNKGKLVLSSVPLIIATKLLQPFCDLIIVKSQNIFNTIINKKKAFIIPNGVNLNVFNNSNNNPPNVKLKYKLLFLGDKNDERKNINLIYKALELLNNPKLELICPYPTDHEQVTAHLQTADIFLLSSTIEGSPNVLKEAMSCGCPLVSTDAGDARWVIGETEGCYIAGFSPKDYAEKIDLAIKFVDTKNRTEGRQRIKDLGLDSETIALKIIELYKKALD